MRFSWSLRGCDSRAGREVGSDGRSGEAQSWALAIAQADSTELVGVVVHDLSADAVALSNCGGIEHVACRWLAAQQLGNSHRDLLGQGLEILRRQSLRLGHWLPRW